MATLVHRSHAKSRAGARASGRRCSRRVAVFLWAGIATALAACQFNPGSLDGTGDNGDPPRDADPSARDASPSPGDGGPGGENCGWPFAPEHFDPCAINPIPLPSLVLDDGLYVYDTNTNELTNPAGGTTFLGASTSLEQDGDVRALWVNGLEIDAGSTLRVKGRRPLMIISTGDIRVRGIIDVSSTLGSDNVTYDPGAGVEQASDDECSSSSGQIGGECNEGGGGGGGGGFAGAGADGGRGANGRDCDGEDGIAGGAGGSAVSLPATIRGGCPGEHGGNGDAILRYGLGGFGGGAVHLVSMSTIDIEGEIRAGGAAGSGAENNRSGGGGGGSGGFIGLEALDIEIDADAILSANGGGGGGGCNNGRATSGEDGQSSDLPASGGLAQSGGGNGGDGGARIERDGVPGDPGDRGGGGGGGGAGFIVTYQANPAVDGGAVISPALTER
jgi:hypothetical protein